MLSFSDMPPATRADDKRSVLLVDDDEFLLGIYQLKFEHRGYQVRPFHAADQALHAMRAGLTPSAIVIDLALPGIDGFAFLETLTAEHLAPGAARLILTN